MGKKYEKEWKRVKKKEKVWKRMKKNEKNEKVRKKMKQYEKVWNGKEWKNLHFDNFQFLIFSPDLQKYFLKIYTPGIKSVEVLLTLV